MENRPYTLYALPSDRRATGVLPRVRWWCVLYLLAFWCVVMVFRVEFMDFTGTSAFLVVSGLAIIALACSAALAIDAVRSVVPAFWGHSRMLHVARGILLGVVVLAGPVVAASWPRLPFASFVWRNERSLIEAVRADPATLAAPADRMPARSVSYRWHTFGTAKIVFFHQPDARAGRRLVEEQADGLSAGRRARHVYGPWYFVTD